MSIQQERVLQAQRQSIISLDRANEHLDYKKIAMLVTISAISIWQLQHSLFAFIFLILGIALSMKPDNYTIPGTSDWDELYEKYIYVDDEKCLDQFISDHFETITKLLATNESKTKSIYWLFVLVVTQVITFLVMQT